ncbi:MAG: S49 family peptidase, partial [Limnohabitans sp.]|nr:S49 family peptidase [Limnohabitans sp.]
MQEPSDPTPESRPETPPEPAARPDRQAWERETLAQLAFATLAERRAERRWRIFFRAL